MLARLAEPARTPALQCASAGACNRSFGGQLWPRNEARDDIAGMRGQTTRENDGHPETLWTRTPLCGSEDVRPRLRATAAIE